MNMTLSCTRKETREKERQEDQTSGPEEIWRAPIREGEDRCLVPDKDPGIGAGYLISRFSLSQNKKMQVELVNSRSIRWLTKTITQHDLVSEFMPVFKECNDLT